MKLENPLSTVSTEDYYYVGVSSFAQIQDGSFVLVNSDVVMSDEQIQRVMETEVWVRSLENSNDISVTSSAVSPAATTAEVSVKVQPSYFESLAIGDFPENNAGDCVIVAISMMLEYYDTYVNDSYVPSGYSPNTLRSVPTIYTYDTMGQRDARWLLDDDRIPVLAYTGFWSDGSEYNHAVVAYGYKESSGTLTHYYIHQGWQEDLSINIDTIVVGWVDQYACISDCTDSGEHSYVIRDTARNYHSGNLHYYQKEYDCRYCFYSYYAYVSGACPGGCIELMNHSNHGVE